MVYVLTAISLLVIGALLIMGILAVRPQTDAAATIGQVAGFLAPTIAGVLSFMKSQETHARVNGRLDEFVRAQKSLSRAEGVVEGSHVNTMPCANTQCPLNTAKSCVNDKCPLYSVNAVKE